MKFYSQPYDKDIGNTLVGEFIGTCNLGSNEITVMQPVGAGLTFGVGQIIVSVGKTAILPVNAKIVGVGTTAILDIRIIGFYGYSAQESFNRLDNGYGLWAPAGASAITDRLLSSEFWMILSHSEVVVENDMIFLLTKIHSPHKLLASPTPAL